MKLNPRPFTKENNVKYETIIKNLGTIRTIAISDKLYISDDNIIFIQRSQTFLGLIRWWYKYNRINTAEFLIEMFQDIDSLISILTFIIDNQKPRKKQKRRRRTYYSIIEKKTNLINYIDKARKGLENLILTYSNDIEFCDSINTILDKYTDGPIYKPKRI